MKSAPLFQTDTFAVKRDLGALINSFGTLPRAIGRRALKQGLERGAIPFAKALKQITPKKKGGLKKSIKRRAIFYTKSDFTNVGVMVVYGKGGAHANWMEYGTKERVANTTDPPRATGHVTAKHMMEFTRRQHEGRAVREIETSMMMEFDKALLKMNAK